MTVRARPRLGRQIVDELVVPQLPSLVGVAHEEHRSMMHAWRRDPRVRAARFDGERFDCLREIVERRLKRVLAGRNRRVVFNTIRSLTVAELRALSGIEQAAPQDLGKMVIEASRVVCAYARPAVLSGELSRREREELSDLPALVTRTILLVSLLFQADSGYRRAARPDDPRQALLPRLFRVIEKDRLALDLIATKEFLDLCYREVVASRDVGRGRDFERLARPYLEQRLGLKPPWPVPPNFKFRRNGQTAGENDFCFFWRDAVVHMDMKAKGRSDEIFQGVHEKTRNRVSQLGDRLFKQVEPRGEMLSEHLHGRYVVVDLLCTSDVEYLPPDPRLRYGSVPRVLTPAEIADVLLDDERWAEMLNGATLAIRDRG